MNITDVRVRIIAKTEGKMKAVASITFDDCFVVHDIKIIEGHNGLFVAMPSRKVGDGDYKDIAHPINTETRNLIQSLILEKYDEALDEQGVQRTSATAEETADVYEQPASEELSEEIAAEEEVVEAFETEELGSATSL